jgi:hypothetical protein
MACCSEGLCVLAGFGTAIEADDEMSRMKVPVTGLISPSPGGEARGEGGRGTNWKVEDLSQANESE